MKCEHGTWHAGKNPFHCRTVADEWHQILICVEVQWQGHRVTVGDFCTVRHHNILYYNLSRPLTTKINLNERHKSKGIPLQAWTSTEGSRRLKLPDFKTFGT